MEFIDEKLEIVDKLIKLDDARKELQGQLKNAKELQRIVNGEDERANNFVNSIRVDNSNGYSFKVSIVDVEMLDFIVNRLEIQKNAVLEEINKLVLITK